MKEQILAVQRMQDYIEKNRTEEISLSDLARVSLFSPWYSYRLFRDSLGLTPTEYIRKYRLTQAAKQLRSGNVRVIDAAFDAGFSNVDTFTRAFYREYGLNPSDYMRDPVPVKFFIPYGAKYRELRKENIDMSNIQPIFIQVIRKPERLCIIKRGRKAEDYFQYCAVSLATLSVAALLRGVQLHGSGFAFLGSWALTMISTLSIGMLAGGVAKDTRQASVIAPILYFPMLIFSGTTLPIEVMPPVMQKVVSFFPLTQGLTMMKTTFLGISTVSLMLPVCVMIGVTALCTVLSVRFFRWE